MPYFFIVMQPKTILLYKSFILFTFLALFASKANAQSLLGAELGYNFSQDSGFTEITLTTYSLCSADSHPDPLVRVTDRKNTKYVLLSLIASEEITPICNDYKSPCRSDNPDIPIGIRKKIFTGKLDMSIFEDCTIIIGWNGGKRADTIGNLQPDQDLYAEAKFSICNALNNKGPEFEFPPLTLITHNNQLNLNQGAKIDEYGDSLVYELVPPKKELDANAIFNPGFNALQPFDSNTSFLYDINTGQLTIKRSLNTNKYVSAIAYKVTKWGRNKYGKTFYKGEVTREMAAFILDMKGMPGGKPPQLTGINGSYLSTDFFVPGQQKCFSINCFDPDKLDSLKVTWNNGIPGATFSVEKNKKHPRAQFCWTGENIPRGTYKEYTFIVTVTDDACPFPSIAQRVFKIIVGGYPDADAGEDVISCVGDSAQLKATGGKMYRWFPGTGLSNPLIADPKAFPGTTTKYYVEVRDSVGKYVIASYDSVTVYVFGDCVWPGETNRDMVPDMKDILPIGVSHNIDGFKRQYATTEWQAEKCLDWNSDIAEKINNKHPDCNGDGIIDTADAFVVLKNYTQNPDTVNYFIPGDSTSPKIGFIFNKNNYRSNEEGSAELFLGTSTLPAKDIYGLALRFGYDATVIDPGSLKLETQNSWLVENNEEIQLSKNFPHHGIFDIGLCKINHKAKNGSGTIAKIMFRLNENLPSNSPLQFTLLDAKVINAAYEDKQLRLPEKTEIIIVDKKDTSQKTTEGKKIKLYPNPASNTITIGDEDERITEIRLINALGQILIFEKTGTKKKHTIHIETVPSGVYFISVLTNDGIETLSVSVIK